jgi:hypothetical protein
MKMATWTFIKFSRHVCDGLNWYVRNKLWVGSEMGKALPEMTLSFNRGHERQMGWDRYYESDNKENDS